MHLGDYSNLSGYKIIIEKCNYSENEVWNTFVNNSNSTNIFHLFEWKAILEKSYRLETLFLKASDSSELIGILPVAKIKNLKGQNIAVSLPFSNYSGWLIKKEYESKNLKEQFLQFLLDEGILRFENRLMELDLSRNTHDYILRMQLPKNSDLLWSGLDAKVRNQVRKAQKSNLGVVWGKEQLNDFYNIYSRHIQSLGTPVHSFGFFQNILDYLPDLTEILTVRLGKKVIGAMFLTKYKNVISDPWAASLKKYLPLNPNMLMYWEALKYSCDNRFEIFDFGRSQVNSGTYKFKTQWGAEPKSLNYENYFKTKLIGITTTEDYRGKKAGYFSTVWKKIPYPVAKWLGPKLRKRIP